MRWERGARGARPGRSSGWTCREEGALGGYAVSRATRLRAGRVHFLPSAHSRSFSGVPGLRWRTAMCLSISRRGSIPKGDTVGPLPLETEEEKGWPPTEGREQFKQRVLAVSPGP